MIKFFKIITLILFSLFFIFGILTSLAIVFGPKIDTFLGNILFLLVVFNFLMLYYVNWAIWTKGKKRKIIMTFVVFVIIILMSAFIGYE